jgi:hypothetical protein
MGYFKLRGGQDAISFLRQRGQQTRKTPPKLECSCNHFTDITRCTFDATFFWRCDPASAVLVVEPMSFFCEFSWKNLGGRDEAGRTHPAKTGRFRQKGTVCANLAPGSALFSRGCFLFASVPDIGDAGFVRASRCEADPRRFFFVRRFFCEFATTLQIAKASRASDGSLSAKSWLAGSQSRVRSTFDKEAARCRVKAPAPLRREFLYTNCQKAQF